MLFIGYDIGSSFVKSSLFDAERGIGLAQSTQPAAEMKINAPQAGWAEQDPETWWRCIVDGTQALLKTAAIDPGRIGGIGISYQMHGLVVVDKESRVLRPSIIWCDSRAVEIGRRALEQIGEEIALSTLLNSPGNFTASKLRWVRENEPDIYRRIDRIMLPGDFIALKLGGEACTTVSGLSEGIFWDFQEDTVSQEVLAHYGISESLLAGLVPTFGEQGRLRAEAANTLGLPAGIPITYRAGDQPNNAFSLNVLQPGEVAATAGTSGVMYGVTDQVKYDPYSRVNTFAHVNHSSVESRLGILLCINGTGIAYSWLRKMVGAGLGYLELNDLARSAPPGADGLICLPFGNGAERVLRDKTPGAVLHGADFNRHSQAHLVRAVQEGIAFSFRYGLDVMREMDMNPGLIRAGEANLFLSPLFRSVLASLTGATIELYNTDGAQGAARGAAVGAGYYASFNEAFNGLRCEATIEPDPLLKDIYEGTYAAWLDLLCRVL